MLHLVYGIKGTPPCCGRSGKVSQRLGRRKAEGGFLTVVHSFPSPLQHGGRLPQGKPLADDEPRRAPPHPGATRRGGRRLWGEGLPARHVIPQGAKGKKEAPARGLREGIVSEKGVGKSPLICRVELRGCSALQGRSSNRSNSWGPGAARPCPSLRQVRVLTLRSP